MFAKTLLAILSISVLFAGFFHSNLSYARSCYARSAGLLFLVTARIWGNNARE